MICMILSKSLYILFDYIERIYIYISLPVSFLTDPRLCRATPSTSPVTASYDKVWCYRAKKEVSEGDPQTWGKEILLKHVETKFQKLAIGNGHFLMEKLFTVRLTSNKIAIPNWIFEKASLGDHRFGRNWWLESDGLFNSHVKRIHHDSPRCLDNL